MKSYPTYKDSGIAWIGKIPEKWKIVRGKYLFRNGKEVNTGMRIKHILSLTLNGVTNRDTEDHSRLSPSDYATYQIFEKGDLVFKLIDLENVQTSRVGIVNEQGIMSPVYIRLRAIENIVNRYFYYQYYDLYNKRIYNALGYGVRASLSAPELLHIQLVVPEIDEQEAIVYFLDTKLKEIDEAFEKNDRIFGSSDRKNGLLLEYKKALISEVVTGKIDVRK